MNVLVVVTGIGGDDSNFAGAIYPSLLAEAQRLVGDQAAADLVQEGFVTWYARGLRAADARQMRGYIGKTMRSRAVNSWRRRRDLLDLAGSIEETPWLV